MLICSPVCDSFANIVKGERRGKRKHSCFILPLPNRILYYENIVKGERRGKRKHFCFGLHMPNRILYYENIVKVERRGKRKHFCFILRMPNRILYYANIAKGECRASENIFVCCMLFAEVYKNKKRNESFDPFLKTIFQNDLFHFLNDSLECFVVVHCKVGESLAVDLDSSLVESTHEL